MQSVHAVKLSNPMPSQSAVVTSPPRRTKRMRHQPPAAALVQSADELPNSAMDNDLGKFFYSRWLRDFIILIFADGDEDGSSEDIPLMMQHRGKCFYSQRCCSWLI